MKKNIVFVGKSLDGFIAGKNGELDWLNEIPNPDNIDMGYGNLMDEIDALIMGKTTYQTVINFDGPWPYTKPVFVLSNSLNSIPDELSHNVSIVNGQLTDVLEKIHAKGFYTLYIDGGKTVQSFLEADLIDELRITTLPILLGGGVPLFSELTHPQRYQHVKTEVFLNQIVQSQYKRIR